MSVPPVSRRAFLKSAGATLTAPLLLQAQPPARETLYNSIVLPSPWPPRRVLPTGSAERPPYLAAPPAVINVDVGRQLFVDDFLIEESDLYRAFHRATYHPASPVLRPERDWERRDPYAANTQTSPSSAAMPFSDGVFYDPQDGLFKLWYMAGYQQATALATSRDGITWQRPAFDVVAGTNIVQMHHRDSSTVWLDHDAPAPARFKMATFIFEDGAMRLSESRDGIHWRTIGTAGPCADRSTFFRNPFRNVWVFSFRADHQGSGRYRRYLESRDFAATRWTAADPVAWSGADRLDAPRPELAPAAELYNLDAVGYESVMLGLFTIYRGESTTREKPNDLCVGFSRDGFHWDRSSRQPFITVSERPGDWNWGNVQSAGGCCVIAGDHLYFYVSGRSGVPGTNLPGECSTGLATLRRDGFASLTDAWPSGVPRRVSRHRSAMTTRPLRFSGSHVFVNAAIDGELRVAVLDRDGAVIPGYDTTDCNAVRGDSTRHAVTWRSHGTLEALRGRDLRLRFTLSGAHLYAFWIAADAKGHSRGYLAAGGPGLAKSYDAP